MSETKSYLTFDFETVDPYIERKLGAGWVYGIKVPSSDFEVLGVAKYVSTDAMGTYYTSPHSVINLEDIDYLVAHNAQYDLGS
jgi:hypothetical protein